MGCSFRERRVSGIGYSIFDIGPMYQCAEQNTRLPKPNIQCLIFKQHLYDHLRTLIEQGVGVSGLLDGEAVGDQLLNGQGG
jgi:hypothetical protein